MFFPPYRVKAATSSTPRSKSCVVFGQRKSLVPFGTLRGPMSLKPHHSRSKGTLRFGGFGLRSLSHHSSAAFIASFCSSGFATANNHHLIHVVNTFNSLVSTSDAISPESAIESPPSQRSLSHTLDSSTYNTCSL